MAAVLDVFADIQSVADGDYLDIQPDAGEEVNIHNIYHEGNIEIYRYDGTNSIIIDSPTASGCLAFFTFHCTNTDRMRVRNVSGLSKLIGYDGVYTKVA